MTAQLLVEKKKLENPPLKIHYLGDRVYVSRPSGLLK
jgi:peptide deformylase